MNTYYHGFIKTASFSKQAMKWTKMIDWFKQMAGTKLRSGTDNIADYLKSGWGPQYAMAGRHVPAGSPTTRGQLPQLFNRALINYSLQNGISQSAASRALKRKLRSVGINMTKLQQDNAAENLGTHPQRVYVDRSSAAERSIQKQKQPGRSSTAFLQ